MPEDILVGNLSKMFSFWKREEDAVACWSSTCSAPRDSYNWTISLTSLNRLRSDERMAIRSSMLSVEKAYRKVLAPIWIEKADTAKKIRQRLRMIIKWARAQGYFTGDDPIELAEQALPKVKASGAHFKSVSYDDLPEIIDRLQHSSVSLLQGLRWSS